MQLETEMDGIDSREEFLVCLIFLRTGCAEDRMDDGYEWCKSLAGRVRLRGILHIWHSICNRFFIQFVHR